MWVLILAATALGGALSLWHRVSHTKLASEEMLRQYAEMLLEARKKRQHELAAAEDVLDTEPADEP